MSLFIFGTYPTGRVDVANEDGDVLEIRRAS